MGCKSTTRVPSLRYSLGDGGSSTHLPSRLGGSLKAQCFTSPCPPCITAQRTPSQLSTYFLTLALGKCRLESLMRSFLSMRSKHSSRSAFSKESGCVRGSSFPPAYHSSMPQK